MRKYFLLFLFLMSSNLFFCQNDSSVMNPRAIQKTGFDFRLLGPTFLLAIEANHFINQNINIQAGIGLIGYYAGFQYYHGKKKKKNLIAPYSGFNIGYFYVPDFGPGAGPSGTGIESLSYYFPLGFQLMIKNGFHFSLEGAMFLKNWNTPALDSYVWGSFKIGKNF